MEGIADYEFVRTLGEAGHGTFFLATPPERLGLSGRLVCVKVLAGADNADGLRRATRELRAFAAVTSPYLVSVLDAGQQGDSFYYATEYFAEGSLAEPASPLDRSSIVRAVAQAARGAHALHQAQLVHRGIKPSSVLLHAEGARLADLGLIQALNPTQAMTGLGSIGVVEYVDPSVLFGNDASVSSDIWSLAVTLHKALTGEGIYGEIPSDDPLLAVRRVMAGPAGLHPSLSDVDSAFISRCLSADVGERPASALAFAEDLEATI
jgi:serine/threonine protein kinase